MTFQEIFAKYDNKQPYMRNPAADARSIPEIITREDAIDFGLYAEKRIFDASTDAAAMEAVGENRALREKMYKNDAARRPAASRDNSQPWR